MKKLTLLFLLPLIVATTCEDDDLINSGFETDYILQNDSEIDLILFTDINSQITIESGSGFTIATDLNQETNSISPSETFGFSTIKLYKAENDNFILVYKQDPIDDSLWVFNEPSINRYNYKLIVTNKLIGN